jgi:hypothetical protein
MTRRRKWIVVAAVALTSIVAVYALGVVVVMRSDALKEAEAYVKKDRVIADRLGSVDTVSLAWWKPNSMSVGGGKGDAHFAILVHSPERGSIVARMTLAKEGGQWRVVSTNLE